MSHCGMFTAHMDLCPALRQLKEEHVPLRHMMEDMVQTARAIVAAEEEKPWKGELMNLNDKVARFFKDLHPHSEREEGVLFKAMEKHIGKEGGPLAVMEYEHDQAKGNIGAFFDSVKGLDEQVGRDDAIRISGYAIQAYEILDEHFMKEEQILFPMAEQMLSPEEKEELLAGFAAIQV